MLEFVKQRMAKNSKRGLYIQDLELKETAFKPGDNYKYIVDVKNKKVVIIPSDSGNTVSKRMVKDGINPVIDIRSKEALSAFEGCDYLQVTLYQGEVVVEGFVENKETFVEKTAGMVKKLLKGKVTDIVDLLQVRRIASATMALDELRNVVGIEGQISITEYLSRVQSQVTTELEFEVQSGVPHRSNVVRFSSALSNLKIAFDVLSLFSGAGMMDYGFTIEGAQILAACELNSAACKSYRKNVGDHMMEGDIIKLNDANAFPNTAVVIGGPPCQGFSNANRTERKYLEDKNNLMVKEFIRTVKNNPRCKVFVLENVPQILTAGDGAFKNEILTELKDFEIDYGIINSAEMGEAQARKRAIFIGSKIGRIELPKPIFTDEANQRTVREAFAGLHDGIPNQLDFSKPKADTLEKMKFVPMGGNVFAIPEELRPKSKHSCYFKRLHWDKPSITIVNPRKSNLIHPEEHRILSVRECARLFGLPDSFSFLGSIGEKQQQVCNGVPMAISSAIARVVKAAIDAFNSALDSKISYAF